MAEVAGTLRRGRAAVRDWTQGSIVRNLFSLAWPVIISSMLNMLGPTIDMIWVGRLGSTSVAGVGVAGIAVMLVDSMKTGITMGMRATVARSIGAGDYTQANYIARQGFVVSAIFGAFLAAVGIFLAEPIMTLMGVNPDVAAQGAAYLRIMFVGSMFMSFRMMGEGVMQAAGDTVTPMRIALTYRLLHVALAPFLIFGWWIFPRMEVSGAAMTNVFSQALGLSIGMWVLLTGRTRLHLSFVGFRFDRRVIWRIVKIGIPAGINGMERSIVNVVMMRFIVPFGTLAVAAHTIQQRVEMVLLMPGMGLGMASGVLAGQNLGARQPERAERTGWIGSGIVEGIMLVGSAVVFLWAEPIVRIFNSEPGVVEVTAGFLRIAAAGNFFMGFAAVLAECLNGTGDTLVPMVAGLITMWGAQVPLAFFLPKMSDLGVYGVRWAMVISLAMRAITYVVYFKLGAWKRRSV